MPKSCIAGFARPVPLALLIGVNAVLCFAQPFERAADPLLVIDQRRTSVVERIVATWGVPLAQSSAHLGVDALRTRLLSLRADHLLAASLTGTLDGLREIVGAEDSTPAAIAKPQLQQMKALGDNAVDVVYTPITPCRLVETRGTFAAVYQGNGTTAHTPLPFTPNQIRTYTVRGGNGVCLTQLPVAGASAVQLQVFGMPTTAGSGDIEILPQGAAFGSTATMVYVSSLAFNTVSTNAKINLANNQISVQVRGGGAHVAIDVVGFFKRPGNYADDNIASGAFAAVGGGLANAAIGLLATVAGGSSNTASGETATVGGGLQNTANGVDATVGGGSGNTASGEGATVPGGGANIAQGFYSVATGQRANALHRSSFVWNGWNAGSATSFRPNSFQIHGESGLSIDYGSRRPDGGGTSWVFIGNNSLDQAIATSTGAFLSIGGAWTNSSDRDRKTAERPIDPHEILQKVNALPITSWQYKDEDAAVRHLGPMAQDFRQAFGLGVDERTIALIDASGVALAAIQGLNAQVQAQREQIAALQSELADLRAIRVETMALKAALAELRPGLAAFAVAE